jgi:hypothetical protein
VIFIFEGPKKEHHPYFRHQLNKNISQFEENKSTSTIQDESIPILQEKINNDPS